MQYYVVGNYHHNYVVLNIINLFNSITWFAHNWLIVIDWEFYSISSHFAINIERPQQGFSWLYRDRVADFSKFRQVVLIWYKSWLGSNWDSWSCFDLSRRWWWCWFCFYYLTFLAWSSFSEVFTCLGATGSSVLIQILSGTTSIILVMVLGLSSSYSISITFL